MNRKLLAVLSVAVMLFMGAYSNLLSQQTQRNPVLEECTGTWCQWCPCGHTIMAQILASMPNAIMIGYHGPANGSDPFSYFPGNEILSLLNFTGYPTAVIDRTGPPMSRSAWTGVMNNRYNVPATVAIEVQRSYNELTRELNALVSVEALENLTGDYRMTMILLEDGLIYPQTGNGSCPGANDYVHNHVVRSMLNGSTGEDLNGGNPWNQGDIIQKTVMATIPAEVNPDSSHLVVLVHKVASPLYNAEIQQGIKLELSDPNYLATMNTEANSAISDPSEPANFNVYLSNIGLLPDTYTLGLDFEGPGGWTVSFTTVNGTFNLGETDTVTVVPGDSTLITIDVNANSIRGYGSTTLTYVAEHGGAGFIELRYTTNGLDLLVVDDDGGANYEEWLTVELDSLNKEYGVVTSDAVVDAGEDINTFNTIIWDCANFEPTIEPDEMAAIKTFLDNGGYLYLNGVDIAYELADPTSPYYTTETADFVTNYLHTNYILKEFVSNIAEGIDGDPITDGLPLLGLVGGTGASTIKHSQGHYPNQIDAADTSSAPIVHYFLKPDEYCGIRAIHYGPMGVGRVVFTTFGFETIAESNARHLFAERVTDWLTVPVSVEEFENNAVPTSFSLLQNYPNPFNPSTTIVYNIPKLSFVSLKVYDLMGQEVATLVNEEKDAGSYSISFDASNISSGMYIYQLNAGGQLFSKKMTLIK